MESLKKLNVWVRRALAAMAGAAAGYAYYHYIGCMSGTCPITSNPYISTLYGAAVGALMISGPKKKEEPHGTDTAAGQKV